MARAALSWGRVSSHVHECLDGTHKFIVLDVQEDQLGPEVGALGGFDDLQKV